MSRSRPYGTFLPSLQPTENMPLCSIDTSELRKHKHRELITMAFWFLIREQNAQWMKPPEFSRKPPVLCAFMVWPHPFISFCSKPQVKGTVLATCDVVHLVPIAPHHRCHKSTIAFLFYRTSPTIACRKCAKRPAWSHKAGPPLNLMPPGLHYFTFSPSPTLLSAPGVHNTFTGHAF